ncbi:MAG: response regulator transcription factor [Methylococcaceae bacterium]|jgi:DNA-binding NarL/FixJ family response regulator
MKNVLILSHHTEQAQTWKTMLSCEYHAYLFNCVTDIIDFLKNQPAHLIVVDTNLIDFDANTLSLLKETGLKLLLIGHNWSEQKQINALIAGVSGYCENEAALELLLKASKSILKGDIWIQRHLVPQVIGALIKFNQHQQISLPTFKPNHPISLGNLTNRELDVAHLIGAGKNNKAIAHTLNISERTVKAHLTSIFQKLNIQDRLHLALIVKESN